MRGVCSFVFHFLNMNRYKKVFDALKTVCYMRKRFSAFLLGCLMCCFRGVVESDEVRCCFASLFFSRSLLIHSGPWESGSWDFLTYSSSEREVLSALDKDFFFGGCWKVVVVVLRGKSGFTDDMQGEKITFVEFYWNFLSGWHLRNFDLTSIMILDPAYKRKKKSFGNWNPLKFIVDGWWLVKLWSIVGAGICSGVEVFQIFRKLLIRQIPWMKKNKVQWILSFWNVLSNHENIYAFCQSYRKFMVVIRFQVNLCVFVWPSLIKRKDEHYLIWSRSFPNQTELWNSHNCVDGSNLRRSTIAARRRHRKDWEEKSAYVRWF